MPAPSPGGSKQLEGKDLEDLKDVHRSLATWMENILDGHGQKVVAKPAGEDTADIPVSTSSFLRLLTPFRIGQGHGHK